MYRWCYWLRTRLPMQETQKTGVQSLSWEDALEEEMATHSSILAWRIPGQRSLEGYSSQCRKDRTRLRRLHVHHPSSLDNLMTLKGLCL